MLLTGSELVLSGDLAPSFPIPLQHRWHRRLSGPLLRAGVAEDALSPAPTFPDFSELVQSLRLLQMQSMLPKRNLHCPTLNLTITYILAWDYLSLL